MTHSPVSAAIAAAAKRADARARRGLYGQVNSLACRYRSDIDCSRMGDVAPQCRNGDARRDGRADGRDVAHPID
ncbi:hypothetical protein [Telmatospirillum sp.]|uniref:hypothetical protein n=1 Tax=Telmatospirillum sp. TaxID=2079197 RepID=UPI00284FD01E|nr:hypothetical protein [Telmatospirillum sp.]MDR3435742.1 hypothetical protein [Telmatospirillum sp.]